MINSRFLKSRVSEEEEVSLSNEDFFTLKEFIYERSGIFLADNKREFLETRVKRRVTENGFSSVKDYYYFLKYSTNDKEFKVLMDAVTINETKFFRDLPLLESFEKEVVSDILEMKKKKGENSLKILSAGCSTGEEPYTLGMLLQEKKEQFRGMSFRITAGDISEEALTSAKNGIYKETQLRSTPESYIRKYFTKMDETNVKVSSALKMNIDFTYLNLADFNNLKRLGNFDIIFCRNVMIYFDNEFKKKLIKTYYEMLKEGGYFFVGHSESLFGINNDFKMKVLRGTTVYKKEMK